MYNQNDILQKLARQEATPQEIEAFEDYLRSLDENGYQQLIDEYGAIVQGVEAKGVSDKELFLSICKAIHDENITADLAGQAIVRKLQPKRTRLYIAAAVFIAVLFTGSILFFNNKKELSKELPVAFTGAPGKDKAILTLADGRQIVLDEAKEGTIAGQNGAKVIKLDSGLIAYNNKDVANATGEITYNTIATPRGGRYTLILPDGTQVWLNAVSSLRFPTSFRGNERKVELTGEGFFDVTHDASKPFTVAFNNTSVKVLGTQFNIMAYSDEENAQTTLVKGSVQVNDNGHDALLVPGKMAVITNDKIAVKDANIEEVTAWKTGQIALTDASLSTVMRQISRWYDVDVHYIGTVPDIRIFGSINKSVYLSTIVAFLRKNGVHITQEGRNITITQ